MKIRKKLKSTVANDVKKSVSLKSSLAALSFKARQKELDDSGSAKLKVRVNLKGNQRGMHMADNSEAMRKLRAMRKIWNAKMPVLHCSNCQFSQQCPAYKPGYECAFNRFANAHEIQTEEDLIFYAKELANAGVRRAQRMLIAETLSGGTPSLETTEALSHVFGQLMQLHDRVTASTEIELEADGSQTIIGKLFGGLTGIMDSTRTAINAPIHVPGSSAEALLEDRGAAEAPALDGIDSPPRKIADPELVRSFVAGSNNGHTNHTSKPMMEELPV